MQQSPEQLWEEIEAEVAYALAYDLQTSLRYYDEDNVLIPSDARDDDPTKVDVRKRFVRLFESERAFVQRVWAAIRDVAREHEAEVVVLFDIDQTIGSRKGLPSGESATLVRPAAPCLMRQLGEHGVRMGVLTTRGISELRRNLRDRLHLEGIATYVDPAHVTASGMETHADRTVTCSSAEVDAETFSRFSCLLRPPLDQLDAFRAWRDHRGQPLPAKDLNKLLQLASMRETRPQTPFVVVDDRDYAGLLPGREGVTGVHLRDEERAHY